MVGYFAFPPPGTGPSIPYARSPLSATGNTPLRAGQEPEPKQEPQKPADADRAERIRLREERRRKQREREAEEIWKAELDWVRSGGVLRDENGFRDMARTEMYRAEVRRLNEEKEILDRWNAYEERFRQLSVSEGPVLWADMPWPVHQPPSSPADLTPTAIADFLFAPLTVRKATGTRKDKIRQALLRWHPDKLSKIISKVDVADHERVLEGIHSVFGVLRQLQDAEKNA